MSEPLISASYTLENDLAFQRSVDIALREIGDLRSPFKLILRDFYKSEMSIFLMKGPGKYPDFKSEESRKAKLNAVDFEYPLLLRRGKLMRSLTEPNAEGSFNDIKKTYMLIGSDVRNKKGKNYLIFHQSDKPRTKIPLRKALFIGPEAPRFATDETMGRATRWTKTMDNYVKQKLKAIGQVK